jgi:threonine synthase
LGLKNLFFKLEIQNPTGSYKDRFASMAASLMRQRKKSKMIATSSGNTGSALAAYAARFGFELDLYITENTPQEKLFQCLAFGASIYRLEGFGVNARLMQEAISRLEEKARKLNAVLLISAVCLCPLEMQGVKTMAFEICDQLNGSPDHVFIPVGGGGLFLSCSRGFDEFYERQKIRKQPCLHPVQPEGCATVVGPLLEGSSSARLVDCTSAISGLQVAALLDAQEVLEKTLLTNGRGHKVSDEDIYYWQSQLIRQEGIFAEPAAATSLAGLAQAVKEKQVDFDSVIVCLVTGSGFKDMKSIQVLTKHADVPVIHVSEI